MKAYEITYRVGHTKNSCIWFAWTRDEAIKKFHSTIPYIAGWEAIRNGADIVSIKEV